MSALAWLLALIIVAADALLLQWLPISFNGLDPAITWISILIAAAFAFEGRWHRVSRLANCAALWCVTLVAGAILTYAAATLAAPLRDTELARLDAALGFDWAAHSRWVAAHPALATILSAAYESLIFQGVFVLLYLPLRGDATRFFEIYVAIQLSIIVTAAVSAIVPAAGPVSYFFPKLAEEVPHLPHLLALRSGQPAVFQVGKLQGLVNFPSFHCAAALITVWGFRRYPILRWAVGGLNGMMLLSIPAIGTHYLIDLVGGAGVAALSIAAVRAARRLLPHLDAALARIRPLPATGTAVPETRS